jgi:hypothetical protein
VEQVFASLSKRQSMLLLVSVAFGGAEAVEAFAHLPPEEEELLRFRAQTLLQIPREKRVPALAQEIKRLVMQTRRQLATTDPQQLAKVLENERPQLVESMLAAWPSEVAAVVRTLLPRHVAPELKRNVHPQILSIVRWKFEEALKHGGPQVGTFRFSDVITLQARELLAVADRMGARVLATALAGLSAEDREGFLQRLPPDQRSLAAKAAEAGQSRRLSPDDAQTVLEMHGATENPSLGMRSAGVQRLARACVAQSVEFAQRVAARHQSSELGRLMAKWLKEERNRPVKGDGGRMDIVEQLERLAQRGLVDRPLRLPPPASMPKPGGSRVDQMPVLTKPPVRIESTRGQNRPAPERSVAERAPRADEVPSRRNDAPRRDFMAQRAAMKAGVGRSVSQEMPEAPAEKKEAPLSPRAVINAARPPAGRPPVRKGSPSPVTQEVPKRRERTGTKKPGEDQ